ncbi:SDR family oxidoreductase [Pseudonocardia ailaonensis]|uniref:SDR family oxidoreductase n=1 Tax=Pseudonocardia ailaonensis TaxID=367279 RepID=A0ABN2N4Y8_9PSEU
MRTAVVTGGSKGIGLATARALVASGHRTIITGRSAASLGSAQEALGGAGLVATLQLDARDHAAAREALAAAAPDVLVANVGAGFSGTAQDTGLADWQSIMDTNVTTAFTAVSAVLGGMLDRGWGRIVTVGSLASHRGLRYAAAYTASKHALLGLTRAVAADIEGSGVTANLVAPAFVRTDMTTENVDRMVAGGRRTAAEAEEQLGRVSTLGRLLEPEEVAVAVLDLVRGDANGELRILGDLARV